MKQPQVDQLSDTSFHPVQKLHICIYFLLFSIAVLVAHCSSPGSPDRQSVHFSIAPVTTAQRVPDDLLIEVHDDGGFYDAQSVNNPSSNGNVFFRLPRGYYYVDVSGTFNGIKTLYGFSECDASSDKAAAYVVLRNIVSIPIISGDQENIFLQDNRPSPIWDGFPQESTARCFTSTNAVIMRTTVVTSYSHIYLRAIVDDVDEFIEDRPLVSGELNSDAAIFYFCKIAPHNLSMQNPPYPVVRVQCETGRTIPENGKLLYENLINSDNISQTIRESKNDDITAYLTRDGTTRILELRLRRALLALPANVEGEPPTALVIRYRNGNTEEFSDWQSGNSFSNPLQNPVSWGYMEILQE